MYKWVSRDAYVEGGDTSTLLSEGTLHVAVFEDDQTGEWVPLTPATTGMDEARIAVFTRMAGSAVNATTMDRPEWTTVAPDGRVYCALTNNRARRFLRFGWGCKSAIRPPIAGKPQIYSRNRSNAAVGSCPT